MGQTLLNETIIANELLMRFKNNLGFAKNVSHEYDERFQKGVGDTYKLRKGARFVANDGADITSQIQDVEESTIDLVLNKRKNVAFKFSTQELTLTIDRFAERYLMDPAIKLSNQFEVDGLAVAYQACPNVVGTPGTTPATAAVVLEAGKKLSENGAPVSGDRVLVVNPAAEAAMVGGLSTLFNSQSEIGKQYVNGQMGRALGFQWFMAQNIPTHTNGAWAGTVLTNDVTPQTGATLKIDGLTAATAALKKGDIFTIADVYEVNPVTGAAGPNLKQFVVTADTSAVSNAVAALPIYPSIITSGAQKTCSAAAANDKAITLVGTAATGYPQNLAFHKHAFVYATKPLEVPRNVPTSAVASDPDTGLSIRVVSDYNVLTDFVITRCDIFYGWAARRPEWACRLIG